MDTLQVKSESITDPYKDIEKMIKVFIFTFASIFAGYVVSNYKISTLNVFNHPITTYIIIFILVSSFYDLSRNNFKDHITKVLGITTMLTIMLELFERYH